MYTYIYVYIYICIHIYMYTYIYVYIYIYIRIYETTGAMGTDTIRFLREIARKIATRSGEPNAYQHLIQRISVAVQQGNSISIMGTFKPTRLTSDSCICSFD